MPTSGFLKTSNPCVLLWPDSKTLAFVSVTTLRYILAAGALMACCYSAIFGVAGIAYRRNTRESVELAARLAPYNGTYLRRLAGWDTTRRVELLNRAVALNPYEAQGWLQLGFDAEFRRHDEAAAEKCYLQAAAVDKMFLPKSTLANFYFRRENEPAFLYWAKQALSVTPYSADPIFAQMWLMDPNPGKLEAGIPDRPGILVQYASFLMNVRQFSAVPPIIKKTVDAAGSANPEWYGLTTVIGPIMDQLLWSGYPDAALQIWSRLKSAGWIRLPTPSGERPITNGAFRSPIWNHGFDWTVLGNSGIFFNQYWNTGEVRFDFSGDEAERCALMQQWIPLLAGRKYRLEWNGTSVGLSKPAGVSWHLRFRHGSAESPDITSASPGIWEFKAPDQAEMVLLTLEYERPVGEMRANGALILQSVSVQPS